MLYKDVLEIRYSRDALKTLRRMPANAAVLIKTKIEIYAAHPDALGNNVKRLTHKDGLMRLRVGDWRVLFKETGEVLAVVKVAPRGRAYED